MKTLATADAIGQRDARDDVQVLSGGNAGGGVVPDE
jgi:hypothetical protein